MWQMACARHDLHALHACHFFVKVQVHGALLCVVAANCIMVVMCLC
jgi:hypothetical protein